MKGRRSGSGKPNAGTLRVVAFSVAILGCASGAAAQEQQKLFIEGDIVAASAGAGMSTTVCRHRGGRDHERCRHCE
jgi:hypothetical protein